MIDRSNFGKPITVPILGNRKLCAQREGKNVNVIALRPFGADGPDMRFFQQSMTPAQARDFAQALIAVANEIDGAAKGVLVEGQGEGRDEAKIIAGALAWLSKFYETAPTDSRMLADRMIKLAEGDAPAKMNTEYSYDSEINRLRVYGLKTSESEAWYLLCLCIFCAVEEVDYPISLPEMASVLLSMTPEANDHIMEAAAESAVKDDTYDPGEDDMYDSDAPILNPPEVDPAEAALDANEGSGFMSFDPLGWHDGGGH